MVRNNARRPDFGVRGRYQANDPRASRYVREIIKTGRLRSTSLGTAADIRSVELRDAHDLYQELEDEPQEEVIEWRDTSRYEDGKTPLEDGA